MSARVRGRRCESFGQFSVETYRVRVPSLSFGAVVESG